MVNRQSTTSETRDGLIMSVTVGRSSSKHSTNKEVEMGSREQVLEHFDYYISNVIFRNRLNCIKGSDSVRIIMTCPEALCPAWVAGVVLTCPEALCPAWVAGVVLTCPEALCPVWVAGVVLTYP